jgi:hypothetical protein
MELKLGATIPEKPEGKPARKKTKKSKTCSECGQPMIKLTGNTQDGFDYVFFRCSGCGEEMANTDQLHEIAGRSRGLKTYNAKITKWGQSLGLRIPKELAIKHSITHNEEVTIVPEENGFRIVPVTKKP